MNRPTFLSVTGSDGASGRSAQLIIEDGNFSRTYRVSMIGGGAVQAVNDSPNSRANTAIWRGIPYPFLEAGKPDLDRSAALDLGRDRGIGPVTIRRKANNGRGVCRVGVLQIRRARPFGFQMGRRRIKAQIQKCAHADQGGDGGIGKPGQTGKSTANEFEKPAHHIPTIILNQRQILAT